MEHQFNYVKQAATPFKNIVCVHSVHRRSEIFVLERLQSTTSQFQCHDKRMGRLCVGGLTGSCLRARSERERDEMCQRG